jgi:hypothetical protein
MRHMAIVLLVLTIVWCTSSLSFAERDSVGKGQRILQTYVNATIISNDLRKVSSKLNDIVRQYNGTITNMSFSKNEDSGSATIQIPTEKAASLMSEINQLGVVESQSLSTSDYTQSYDETYRKLKTYEALANVNVDKLFAGMNIPREDMAAFKSEFESMITNQMKSYRSSMESYLNYGKYAQVSINFRRAEGSNQQPISTQCVQEISQKSSGGDSNASIVIPLYAAVLLNFFLLYLLYRQIKKSPMGS